HARKDEFHVKGQVGCRRVARSTTIALVRCAVTFASVLNMSGIASMAMRTPTPSAGIPYSINTGAIRNKLAEGMPGTLNEIKVEVSTSIASAPVPTGTP